MLMHASANIESVRPLSNNERRASWAAKYFLHGFHRNPGKPRIRVPVTVPAPQSMPAVTEKHDSPSRAVAAGTPSHSSIAEWDAYYAGTGPRPTLPPF